MMKKRVNIYPRKAITTINPPMRGPAVGVVKSIDDIRKCIIAGARVEEVINNSTKIPLNLNNYDKDNGGNPEPMNVRLEKAAAPIKKTDVPKKAQSKKKEEIVIKAAASVESNPMAAPESAVKEEEPKEEEVPVEEPKKEEVEEKKMDELETMDLDSVLGNNTPIVDTSDEKKEDAEDDKKPLYNTIKKHRN